MLGRTDEGDFPYARVAGLRQMVEVAGSVTILRGKFGTVNPRRIHEIEEFRHIWLGRSLAAACEFHRDFGVCANQPLTADHPCNSPRSKPAHRIR